MNKRHENALEKLHCYLILSFKLIILESFLAFCALFKGQTIKTI